MSISAFAFGPVALSSTYPPAPIRMSNKQERQGAIRDLVATEIIASQEELRQHLLARGWDVTQSTLSRDMRDLRLARIPTPDGVRYAAADNGSAPEDGRAALAAILPQLFVRLDTMREFIVIRTVIGSAQPVAVALDREESPDVLGTIAGDDTILVICRSEAARERVSRRLVSLARRS